MSNLKSLEARLTRLEKRVAADEKRGFTLEEIEDYLGLSERTDYPKSPPPTDASWAAEEARLALPKRGATGSVQRRRAGRSSAPTE